MPGKALIAATNKMTRPDKAKKKAKEKGQREKPRERPDEAGQGTRETGPKICFFIRATIFLVFNLIVTSVFVCVYFSSQVWLGRVSN